MNAFMLNVIMLNVVAPVNEPLRLYPQEPPPILDEITTSRNWEFGAIQQNLGNKNPNDKRPLVPNIELETSTDFASHKV
jgi:hypothetical protein